MNIAGLSQLLSVSKARSTCPQCNGEARLDGRACVRCLLAEGIEAEESAESGNLDKLLAQMDVRDTDWRLGNYQILEEIGRGGMGVIYRARQRHSKRIVALKRLLSYHGDSRETLERFRREAEAAASLDHPNILPIYEVGEEEGLPFFTMKYAAGGSLQRLGGAYKGNPREAVRLLLKVSRAVSYAHGQGILHRDIKPGNILLDSRGEPMVSDFGLAKWLDRATDLTRTLTVFGTPGYVAPEQASCSPTQLTPAADIYSVGALLFDLLTGRPPFLGEHALSVIKQAEQNAAPKLRSLVRSADRDLETICAKCIEREPGLRYRSASDLAEDLQRWLEGRSIVARPVPLPVRTLRWTKRNRRVASLGAVAFMLAVVGVAWQLQNRSLSQAIREKQAAARSFVVLPFLDLDTATFDGTLSGKIAATIAPAVSALGPCSIRVATNSADSATGVGLANEVRDAARQHGCGAVLTGTVRRVERGRRISLRLVKNNGSDVLAFWELETADGNELPNRLRHIDVAHQLSAALDGNHNSLPNSAAGLNATARSYIQSGRDLLDRRTLPDIERAIGCFEGAIRAAPESPEGYSYLGLAYMGRNFVAPDEGNLEKAAAAAKHAVDLAPNDTTAQRSLAAAYIAAGNYEDGLKHAFESLEAPQPTEKAFGQIGFAWTMLGRPDKAIQWYTKAKVTERLPADYDVLIGDCWVALGEADKAEAAYEAASHFRPDLPDGWVGRCYLRLAEGRIDDAHKCYAEHAAEYAQYHNAKQMEAAIEFFSRNFSRAEQLYAALYDADPHANGARQYGVISYESALARLKQERHDPAYDQLIANSRSAEENALKQRPRDPERLYRAAATAAVARDADKAMTLLKAAMEAGCNEWHLPRFDPRFDSIRNLPEFDKLLVSRRECLRGLDSETASFLTDER